MDTEMKINGDMVRALREEKSWSQEHLAGAAGLSVRTVQRVESACVGSVETRLALAGALDVAVSGLMPSAHLPDVGATHALRFPAGAWIGWAIGAACSIGAVTRNHHAGYIDAGELGASLGVICALLGATLGVMGR